MKCLSESRFFKGTGQVLKRLRKLFNYFSIYYFFAERKGIMTANYFSIVSTDISDALCGRMPRDCQGVSLLLSQGIFLRKRKKINCTAVYWEGMHPNSIETEAPALGTLPDLALYVFTCLFICILYHIIF